LSANGLNITKIICLLDMGTMALGIIFVLVIFDSCILSVCLPAVWWTNKDC